MKKEIIVLALCLMTISIIWAESINVAYLDTDRIMEESQATREAQEIFSAEREQWDRELAELDREIERLQSEYEARRLTLTESGRQEAQERIEAKIRERRQFIDSIYGEAGLAVRRNAELLEPIMGKLKDSLEKIALENDYAIIFDAIGGGILYADPDLDITDLVIRDLNEEAGN